MLNLTPSESKPVLALALTKTAFENGNNVGGGNGK
jgi:hypothetical protein